jgi:hypothetical protein
MTLTTTKRVQFSENISLIRPELSAPTPEVLEPLWRLWTRCIVGCVVWYSLEFGALVWVTVKSHGLPLYQATVTLALTLSVMGMANCLVGQILLRRMFDREMEWRHCVVLSFIAPILLLLYARQVADERRVLELSTTSD